MKKAIVAIAAALAFSANATVVEGVHTAGSDPFANNYVSTSSWTGADETTISQAELDRRARERAAIVLPQLQAIDSTVTVADVSNISVPWHTNWGQTYVYTSGGYTIATSGTAFADEAQQNLINAYRAGLTAGFRADYTVDLWIAELDGEVTRITTAINNNPTARLFTTSQGWIGNGFAIGFDGTSYNFGYAGSTNVRQASNNVNAAFNAAYSNGLARGQQIAADLNAIAATL